MSAFIEIDGLLMNVKHIVAIERAPLVERSTIWLTNGRYVEVNLPIEVMRATLNSFSHGVRTVTLEGPPQPPSIDLGFTVEM